MMMTLSRRGSHWCFPRYFFELVDEKLQITVGDAADQATGILFTKRWHVLVKWGVPV